MATANHCFDYCSPPDTCYAVIREHDLTKEEVGQRNIKIKSIHSPSGDSDLALAELEYPVELDKKAQLVRSAEERLSVGDLVWSLGWGMTYGGTYPEVLHKVRLRVSAVNLEGDLTYTEVGNANGIPVDPCSGDSGGPLLAEKNGELVLYATLFGRGYNCKTNITKGYGEWNSLAPHKDWIQKILNLAGA